MKKPVDLLDLLPRPNAAERKEVIGEFEGLLRRSEAPEPPKESEWHRFFVSNPFIFTESIPIQFDRMYSEYRFNSGPVDFLIRKTALNPLLSVTGLIEIKRPDRSILDIYGNHMSLSRNTQRGLTQLGDYLGDLEKLSLTNAKELLPLGNGRFLFLVIGRNRELLRKCSEEVRQRQFHDLLPPGFQILTYDHLFDQMKLNIPSSIAVVSIVSPADFFDSLLRSELLNLGQGPQSTFFLPPRIQPASMPIQRIHSPIGSGGRFAFRSFRTCLRWDFGFLCPFCCLHESDYSPRGAEGLGVFSIQHFVPRATNPAVSNDYFNCLYACRSCNRSRGGRPLRSELGQLLDPSKVSWSDHFILEEDRLNPREGDRDAAYTAASYDINTTPKSKCEGSGELLSMRASS